MTKNKRWKWMAGATAASATAAASSAHGEVVQITLVDNQVSSSFYGGNTLNANLAGTGPSLSNLTGRAGYKFYTLHGASAALSFKAPERALPANKVMGYAGFSFNPDTETTVYRAKIMNSGKSAANAHQTIDNTIAKTAAPTKADLFIPLALSSSNVNAGVLTDALLEIVATTGPHSDDVVTLERVIFDDGDPTVGTATLQGEVTPGGMDALFGTTDDGVFTPGAADVPEPSGLALLALGAGGLWARRRFAKTGRA